MKETGTNSGQRILVTGAGGQLGTALRMQATDYPQSEFVFVGRAELPLDDVEGIARRLQDLMPDLIIHAGAYTAVDRAEDETELSDLVNHLATAAISSWCADKNVRLIYISTDYVFPGGSDEPLNETDPTQPVNAYGRSKWRGEQAVLASGAEAMIIRTSWVYHESGHNFVRTMVRLMQERDIVKVVSDQHGSPTYAADLANALLAVIHRETWVSGIYHYSNDGATTWYDFAVAIKELGGFDCTVQPITTDEFPTAARRPVYSLLDKSKIKATFGLEIPHWRDSLAIAINRIKTYNQ